MNDQLTMGNSPLAANTVPALRFPEFSGEWNVSNIANVLTIGSGRDYKHLESGDIPVYGTGGYMTSVNNFLYDGESVCIGRKGTIDKPILLSGKFWTVDTLFYTHKFNGVIPKFVYAVFKKINWKKYNEASGVPSLSKSTIEKITFIKPELKEQQKIAAFLTSVDTKIEQLSKKKALLEKYKKGMMQKLFSQARRFKDELGNDKVNGKAREGSLGCFPDWEERTFGGFAQKVTDSFNPVNSVENWECIELESLGQGNGQILKTFQAKTLQSIKTKFLSGDVLFGKLRPYLRKYAHVKFNGVCTSEIWVLRANKVSDKFLYFIVQSSKFNQYANIQSGSKMPRSDWNIVSGVKFAIPSKLEQQKIANFLSAIDKKIDLITTELNQAKTFKKGLLQQMFI